MAFCKIFPCGGVDYAAGIVCFREWQSGSFPFIAEPIPHRHDFPSRSECGFLDILDTDFGDNRKVGYSFGICIACDMAHSLVPDIAGLEFPAMFQ